jgi:S-formylglutathione hydrolase FrmB
MSAAALAVALLSEHVALADPAPSRLMDREIHSACIARNIVGINPIRRMVVYLPVGYDESKDRYPVLYFFSNTFESYRDVFDKKGAKSLFDRAIASGAIGKFILVDLEMTTETSPGPWGYGISWYVNSPVTGNWEDFVIKEAIPYIDANFRTRPERDSRGITGEFIGAYGAIRLGMRHPDVFGAVYAMHPVGTGSGVRLMQTIPNWDLLANAKTLDEGKKDPTVFLFIFQAFLPNPNNPPLFIDLEAHKEKDRFIIDAKLNERLRNNFYLETMIPQFADNLKSLRGFKFDWSRNDPNYDHVYANQAFTHKLNDFGIVHEAEEYNGTWGESYWGDEGRVVTDVLPFFQRRLIFGTN